MPICDGKFSVIQISHDIDEVTFFQASALWNASQSLLQSLKIGLPSLSWKHEIRSLETEIDAVLNALSPNDGLSKIVLNSISKLAADRGVFPEEALKARFRQVEKLARKLELVPATGAPLLVYALSYAHSFLLFSAPKRIPQPELNDEEVDLSKLTTSDIFDRAKYHLYRDNLIQALKYMNLLKGASRQVALQWMYEAKILLETQQAAKILMAHATSCCLKNYSSHFTVFSRKIN